MNTIAGTDTVPYRAVSLLLMAAIGATLTPVRRTTGAAAAATRLQDAHHKSTFQEGKLRPHESENFWSTQNNSFGHLVL